MYKKAMIFYFLILSLFLFSGVLLERFPLDVSAQSYLKPSDPALASTIHASSQFLNGKQGKASSVLPAQSTSDSASNGFPVDFGAVKSLKKVEQD
jgi:hypothetical protein